MKAITVIALCVFVGNVPDSQAQCPSGQSAYNPAKNNFPVEDSECFSEDVDVDHKTPYPGDCQSYLYCNPDDCTWRQGVCDNGKYWNNVDGKCVDPANADCGGALFWSGAVVQIENVFYQNKVLTDCQTCGGTLWQDQTPVIGLDRNPIADWFQRLVAKRRLNSQYYSLAFDKGDGDSVKVIQDVGQDKVMSKMLVATRPGPSNWRYVPIPGKKNKILIVSVSTGKAMTMRSVEGDDNLYVRVTNQIDPEDEGQQWIVLDIDGAPFPYVSTKHN